MNNTLAILSYSAARLALNPIVVNIEAANPIEYPDRTGLRYYCKVMVPSSYLSSEYRELITLEGAEVPPAQVGTGLSYQGAFFEIQEQLEALLERKAPDFNQVKIDVCSGLVTPYYCVLTIENNDEEIYSYTQPVQYAIKAGVNERDYAAYKDLFFTEYIGKNRRFLTWSNITKIIHPDQPEFLYWLTNGSPNPTSLKVCYLVRFADGTNETGCSETLSNVYPFSVHCVPVGPKALGLNKKEKIVVSYRVWLTNQADERLSEYREYKIEQEYRRNVRFVIFANSLGGYDTMYLVGRGEENLKVTRNISERFTGWEYLPSYSEQVINTTRGTRELTISTGWLNKSVLRYLEELLLTKEAYLVTDRAYVALVPVFDSLRSQVDDEDLIGRTLTFRFGYPERSFSALPNPANLPIRRTGWRPKAMACLVDGNGKRTGKMAATLLELYYLDDNTRVPGTPIKQNVPGQPGYIPPVESDECSETKFINTVINRAGTYNRKTCASGLTGGPAMINIPAGTFGSDISQADAQAKAETEYNRINTQEFANLRGVCILKPEFYEVEVPNGHWHWRIESPEDPGGIVYRANSPYMGNTWFLQGKPGAYVFPMGSNDLNFPIAIEGLDPSLSPHFQLLRYGGNGVMNRLLVYVNGTLIQDRIFQNDTNEGFAYVDIFRKTDGTTFSPVSGDKLYIQVKTL
ncbi:DUF5977 domain-containing protein [Siphonobacter sp. SORGH_AS_0500]|uniref:DUF5977 domain-containing protein n=1 Tax=Siphonobacter sp. SORGH_AS_0500 TaxID=1864824 RepID=UPI002861C877|nr:DUF5977 domain-containing protein [Siphonobacter sp. SORGH_AS_0500]MDR6195166.1 hypothetical protein [Siphonobacter sp. SORGH_AS_0500]